MYVFSLTPKGDLRRVSRLSNRWEVLGSDPFFLLKGKYSIIPAARYWVRAERGAGLDKLQGGSFYFDTGKGFNELEKQQFAFVQKGDGSWIGLLHLQKDVLRLRYDPCNVSDAPLFELSELTLESVAIKKPPENTTRLLINLTRLLPSSGGAGGAGRFALALLEHLPGLMEVRCAIPPHHIALAVQFPSVDFVVCTADDNTDLGHHLEWCDCYLDPLNGLRPKVIPSNVPTISIILDLQHMEMPWLFSRADLDIRRREYRYAISRSDHLIAISDYERKNFQKFYGRDDVTVVHLTGFMAEAAERRLREGRPSPPAHLQQKKRYLIYPAVPWPHKNHEALVQAIAILKQRSVNVPIVLTNTSGDSHGSQRLAEAIRMLNVGDLIDRKAFLTEEELEILFEQAAGLVFPSLYEGFGIPLVDAMKMKVPVLAARTSAAEEIGKDACAYFTNTLNVLAMARDIENFWHDEPVRAELTNRGLIRGAEFSSTRMVKSIVESVSAAMKVRQGRIARKTPTQEIRGPCLRDLHLMVFVGEDNVQHLEALPPGEDINTFLQHLVGTAHVTLCADIGITNDPELRCILEQAQSLMVYNPMQPEALDFAVLEFEQRYHSGRMGMVTDLDSLVERFHRHLPAMVEMINLHPDVGVAKIDPSIVDCRIAEPPSEIEGVLAFERMRRKHYSVLDTLFDRSFLPEEKNGTAAFLAYHVQKSRVLLVPEDRGSIRDQ